eukprot:SAG31_NODE_5062_length_2765_cov_1.297074_1_plen_307_part_00
MYGMRSLAPKSGRSSTPRHSAMGANEGQNSSRDSSHNRHASTSFLRVTSPSPETLIAPEAFTNVYSRRKRSEFRLKRSDYDNGLRPPQLRHEQFYNNTKILPQTPRKMAKSATVPAARMCHVSDRVSDRISVPARGESLVPPDPDRASRVEAAVQAKAREDAEASRRWEEIQPWLQSKKHPRPAEWERQLARARVQFHRMQMVKERRMNGWVARLRALLKDVVFILERLEDMFAKKHLFRKKNSLAIYRQHVAEVNLKIKESNVNDRVVAQVTTFHQKVLKEMFNHIDEDRSGKLDASETSNKRAS